MFATAGDIGVIGFKSLVHGDFKGEVSAWRGKGKTRKPTAESQWKCTEILAQILEGNQEHIRDDGREKYLEIVKKINEDHDFAAKRNDVVDKLRAYYSVLQNEDRVLKDEGIRAAIRETTLASFPQVVSMSRTGDASDKLPPFPDHVPAITALVEGAKTSVAIHADAVDYGSFRNFEAHRKLLEAVMKKARANVPVYFLISTDHQPMSRANKYRDPNQRKQGVFYADLRRFLTALRLYPELAETEVYKGVEEALSARADFSSEEGAIKDLVRLQARLHRKELEELKAAGVKFRGSDRDGTVAEMYEDRNEVPTEFCWIADEVKEVRVITTPGTDAPSENKRGDDVRKDVDQFHAYYNNRMPIP